MTLATDDITQAVLGNVDVVRCVRDAEARGQEVTEMVRHAIGYQSRAFVTFGAPVPLSEHDPAARRDLVAPAHRIQTERQRVQVRDCIVLKYYARTLEHLMPLRRSTR